MFISLCYYHIQIYAYIHVNTHKREIMIIGLCEVFVKTIFMILFKVVCNLHLVSISLYLLNSA